MRDLQASHSFQVKLSLDDCVSKFREIGKKRPRQIKGIDFPPYKLHVKPCNNESCDFQLLLGGEIKLYSSTFIQVQASGQLSGFEDDNTNILYSSKVLWKFPLLLYGICFIVWIFLSSETPIAMWIGLILVAAHVGWETYKARNYLEELPTLIELILAS